MMGFCCCTTASYTITVRAKSCGGVGYTGITIAAKDGSGTTVSTCTTTTGSFGTVSCTLTVPATGTYTITATNSHGLTLTQTTTVVSSGNVVQFNFIDAIPVIVTMSCGPTPVTGAVVNLSATGWSTTVTMGSGGAATVYPTVDLTGLTVSGYATLNGATTPTKTISPTNANCGSLSFSFASGAAVTVTGCNGPLQGASVSVVGPGGETGSGTTDATGLASITITPPITNITGTFSATVSKSRFVTQSTSAAVCVTATAALVPASGYACICDCPDPAPTTLTFTDPIGAATLTYDAANNWWKGTMVRSFPTTYDNSAGACDTPQAADLTMAVYFSGCTLNILVGLCSRVGSGVPCRTCTTPTNTTLGLLSFVPQNHASITCPPAFDWVLNYTMGSEPNVDDRPYEQIYGNAGTAVTFTVTE